MTKKDDLSVEQTEDGRFYVADENYWEVTGNSYDTYEEADEELEELYDALAAEEAREAAEEAAPKNINELLARLRAQGKGIADWLPSPETPEAELWVVAEYEAVEAHDARRKAEIEIERRRVEEVWAEQNYAWCDAGDADTGGPPHLLSREQGTKPRGTSVCGVRPEGTSGWVPHRAPHYPGFYRTCCELCLRLGQGLSLYRNAS